MAKAINPTVGILANPRNTLRQAQSVYKTMTQGLELAVPVGQDSTGIYNQFTPGNSAGNMIRIGAYGTVDNQYSWPATPGDALVINHGLLKQPLGFHITDIDQPAKIYRINGQPLDANNITLATDTPAVNATLFFF